MSEENNIIEDPPTGENIGLENKILPAENKEPPIPDTIDKSKKEKKEKKKKESVVFLPDYSLKPKKNVVNGNLAYQPEELQQAIEDYFTVYNGIQTLKDDQGKLLRDKFGNPITHIKPPTVAGLSLFLGFTGRQSLYDYINRDNESSFIIKKALSRIEQFAESMLYTGKPVGAIFWLKNHKWTDQQQIDVKSSSFESFLKNHYAKDKTNEITEGEAPE